MNQFKHAWDFYLNNWQYFFMLAAPVMFIEGLVAYLILPVQNLTQPEDIVDFFNSNASLIGLVGLFGTVLSISFLGGLYVSYDLKDKGENIDPLNALSIGFKKFFPFLGAYFICSIAIFFSAFLLILPAFYVAGRLALFPPLMMLENKGVMDSLRLSWDKTDEHGGILFGLTLVFFLITFLVASLLQLILEPGIGQIAVLAVLEYVVVIPWGYVYFSLYKSLKNQ
jgi:hypothetical protein